MGKYLSFPEPCRHCGRGTYNPELDCEQCSPSWKAQRDADRATVRRLNLSTLRVCETCDSGEMNCQCIIAAHWARPCYE